MLSDKSWRHLPPALLGERCWCCLLSLLVFLLFVVVVVVVVYLKRLRIVLRCAKAGCGRRTSSS